MFSDFSFIFGLFLYYLTYFYLFGLWKSLKDDNIVSKTETLVTRRHCFIFKEMFKQFGDYAYSLRIDLLCAAGGSSLLALFNHDTQWRLEKS